MGLISAEIGPTKLDSGWIAARSTDISLTGVQLTTTNPPELPTITTTTPPQRKSSSSSWIEASVPGTVLGTLLKNKLIPDPFYGLNNETIIDIADSGREYYTFWFFKTFECKLSQNQYLDIKFRAINYSAEVFLNGHKKTLSKGMFRRHSIDVTDILQPGGKNFLAVLVHPPDHPGRIPTEGGQGGDHEIGKDVAAQYVEGWDWITPIRDRNTGIWDEVSIYVTGPVKIIDPHLVSSFFDDFKRSYLHTSVKLENKSSWLAECTMNIKVTSEIDGNFCLVEHLLTQELKIPPASHVRYTFPPLFFYKPDLWWPKGMGKQSMYHIEITIDVKGHGESDIWAHQFGFRKIESTIDSITGGRMFKVNGQPIFIRGGNWICSDGLLRLSNERYRTDVKFHADMNVNMIRCWGGGLAERPEFYHYCDIYGLLVWQEFWITGDVDGRGIPISNINGPLDHDLFMLCARDTVKLLRNYASLAIWVGGNEQIPPDDINKALKKELKLHPFFQNSIRTTTEQISLIEDSMDPSEYLDGTRSYIQGSLWDGFASGDGNFTDGPYEIQNISDFFSNDYCEYGFNPEIGSVGMPVADMIRATMPIEGWEIPLFKQQSDGYIEEIPNPIWVYHKYIPYSKPGNVHDQIVMYGTPTGLDDFCEKAQLVNYMQYRALIEAWTSRMWTKYTGFLIWKMQNPWTGLRGQLYDHLLDQNGGFYGFRCAAEHVHVQLNLASYFVEVVNTTSVELLDLCVEISVWDLDGNCPFYKVTEKITASPKKVLTLLKIKYPQTKNPKPVYFLLLKLFRISDNGILSRNFYWLHQPGGDYKLLEQYRNRKVPLKVTSDVMITGSSYKVQLLVENISKTNNDVNVIKNDFIRNDEGNYNLAKKQAIPVKAEIGLLQRICTSFPGNHSQKVVKINDVGENETGVAFFLRFSVHAAKNKYEKNSQDTRILPVHYTDNYISLVPNESLKVEIVFDAPKGITPRVTLHGWNYNSEHFVI